MARPGEQPLGPVRRLAERLRDLRERAPARLTQGELGRALGRSDPLSPATISMWENPASGRIPPPSRLEDYALLFCTERAFGDSVRPLRLRTELTPDERVLFEELKSELIGLRDAALRGIDEAGSRGAGSMWHFPDGAPITLVGYNLLDELRPRHADPGQIDDYARAAGLADLDTMIDVYGEIKAYNPSSRVTIRVAAEVTRANIARHIVMIGRRTWYSVPGFSRILQLPIDAGAADSSDPGDRRVLVARGPDGTNLEFRPTLVGDELVEDIGVFARGPNPSAPQRTFTLCSGVTTRGVRGAAQCFIDSEMQERNVQYLRPRFPEGATYCIVMRVPIINAEPVTPDLTRAENRLLEWSNMDGVTGHRPSSGRGPGRGPGRG